MELTKAELQAIIAATAQATAEECGATSGLLSYTQAKRKYGKWFEMSVKTGRLQPALIGEGRNGKKDFLQSDIMTLRANDMREARLQLSNL